MDERAAAAVIAAGAEPGPDHQQLLGKACRDARRLRGAGLADGRLRRRRPSAPGRDPRRHGRPRRHRPGAAAGRGHRRVRAAHPRPAPVTPWPGCSRPPAPSPASRAARTPWRRTPTSSPGEGGSTPRSSRAAGAALTVKGGRPASGWPSRRPAGPALAIKLEAGDQRRCSAVALAALRAAGLAVDAASSPTPRCRLRPPVVRNWAGDAVGGIRVETGWLACPPA